MANVNTIAVNNRNFMRRISYLLGLMIMLTACALTGPVLQTPTLALVSVEPVKSSGLQQVFRVGLKVENPNSHSLAMSKITYEIELEKLKVIRGETSNIPEIKAYGSGLVYVDIGFGLVEGLQLLNRVMSNTERKITYRLQASLGLAKPVPLVIPVSESGVIDLDQLMSQVKSPQLKQMQQGRYSL